MSQITNLQKISKILNLRKHFIYMEIYGMEYMEFIKNCPEYEKIVLSYTNFLRISWDFTNFFIFDKAMTFESF